MFPKLNQVGGISSTTTITMDTMTTSATDLPHANHSSGYPSGSKHHQRGYEEIVAKIQECDQMKQQQWKQISEMISNREEMDLQRELFEDMKRHQLRQTKEKITQLSTVIYDASAVTETSYRRVKELDQIRDRVEQALTVVSSIIDQRNCLDGVSKALGSRDFETAVDYIKRFFDAEVHLKGVEENDTPKLNSLPVEVSEALATTTPVTTTTHQIQKVRESVRQAIRAEFEEAVKSNNTTNIVRYSKLFEPLDLAEEGKRSYFAWLKRIIRKELESTVKETLSAVMTEQQQSLSNGSEEGRRIVQPGCLPVCTQILDSIAHHLESQQEHISTHFGISAFLEFLSELHGEACTHANGVVTNLIKDINRCSFVYSTSTSFTGGSASSLSLSSIASATSIGGSSNVGGAGGSGMQSNPNSLTLVTMEPREMDNVLDEVTQLSQVFQIYFQFISKAFLEAKERQRDGENGKISTHKGEASTNSPQKKKDTALASTSTSSTIEDKKPTSSGTKILTAIAPFVMESEIYSLIQKVLGLYVPLQKEFLWAAFSKAVSLNNAKVEQQKALAKTNAAAAAAAAGGGSSTSSSSVASLDKISGIASEMVARLVSGTDIDGTNAQIILGDKSITTTPNILIDDVFYMLRVTCHRVLKCPNANVISAVINLVTDLVRDLLLPEIQKHIKVTHDSSKVSFHKLHWINSLEMSSEYILKLQQEFETLFRRTSGSKFRENDIAKVLELSSGLKIVADQYNDQLLKYASKIGHLIESQLRQKGLSELEKMSYQISEAEYTNFEINDPWALTTVQIWDTILTPYFTALTESVLEHVIKKVISLLVQRLEEIISQKTYTLSGGLQMDKDIRTLRNYFTSKISKPVHDKFTRLQQIVSLLCLDKVSDVYELWTMMGGSSSQMTTKLKSRSTAFESTTSTSTSTSQQLMWRLTIPEIRAVLSLRVDFEKTAINALKLK